MNVLAGALVAPGFFESGPVRTAIVAGGVVAVVSAAVGVFTVIRGQSFAGHALGDLGTLGGSGALLVGVSPLVGYVTVGVAVAGTMELLGVERQRGRDVATGVVLGAALGISALFLYLSTTEQSTTGATATILFGSLFAVSGATVPLMIGLGLAGLVATALLYRPLLSSSISTEMAIAGGVPVRAVALAFLVLVGISVSLTSVAVGTILSTALLIGPAATALRLAKRPGRAILAASVIGVAATWLGILLAYDSYDWPPTGRGWPVSFFVVALVFVAYVAVDLVGAALSRRPRRTGAVPSWPEAR